MKRFWATADIADADGGFAIALDGRPVRTPKGKALVLPNPALATAVAAEWQAVVGDVAPHAMPLTGLANAAIDIVADNPPSFAAELARYAETDLLCYRAEHPEPLVQRQAAGWDPLLRWAEQRFDVSFRVTAGIVHITQPELTLTRIRSAYSAHAPFPLAALSPLTALSGSAVIALALAERAVDEDRAWAAAVLDEAWQAEMWGEDAEATASRADRFRQFSAAARFLALASERSPA